MASSLTNPPEKVQTSIAEVPVTVERKPYNPPSGSHSLLLNPGTAHVNVAPATTAPDGTLTNEWTAKHSNQTVLQQHCEFFDSDKDGIIWPSDTYRGFREMGFNILISFIAMFVIHSGLAYFTCPTLLPDIFFRLYLKNIHKAKHGSDTGTYDTEGRFIPQRFEDFFSKYGDGKDGLTKTDIWNGIKAQRVIMDFYGWAAGAMEWLITYLLLWPKDGIVRKEDVRKVYDGSIFYEMAAKRKAAKKTA